MSARNIEFATKRLHSFGLRSRLYSFFFLATSALTLGVSAFIDDAQSLSSILTGACLLMIPCVMYFTSIVLGKVTTQILSKQVSSNDQFNTAFSGPFSGVSWLIYLLTFGLAGAEVLFDYYVDKSFGVYSIFLVGFTVVWLARFYTMFDDLKESVRYLKQSVDQVDATVLPPAERILVEEVQRGNTETLVDKRDELNSL